jgi:hypothetical protein
VREWQVEAFARQDAEASGAVRVGEEDVIGFTGDETASVSRQFDGIAVVKTRYSPEGQSRLLLS